MNGTYLFKCGGTWLPCVVLTANEGYSVVQYELRGATLQCKVRNSLLRKCELPNAWSQGNP